MHFVICIWGVIKSLRFTMLSIQRFCLDPLLVAGHTYEILIHTYTFSGKYGNLRNKEHKTQLNFSEWKLLNPTYVTIENQDDFDASINYTSYKIHGDPWSNNYHSFKNHIRALNSLYQVTKVLQESSKHMHIDGVVFLRPDMMYISELPIYLFDYYKDDILFVPDFQRSCNGNEYNDRMAMGDLQSAITYGLKFESAYNYSLTSPLHSEKFTYNYLNSHNINVVEIPFRFRRTRSQGDIHARDYTIITPLQQQLGIPHNVQQYTTFWIKKWIYEVFEILTLYQVYIYNHDDESNLRCHPNKYISSRKLMNFRNHNYPNFINDSDIINKQNEYKLISNNSKL